MKNTSKNVLVLLGSARENGNSTRLAFAFADAASANGHAVQSIRVPALDISPCDGCDECWKNTSMPCAIRDDMDSVYPLVRAADVLVFATPLHFYSWSAPIKTMIDRLYCLAPSRRRNLKGKSSVLLATAADDRAAAFAGLKSTYRLVSEFMEWNNLGEILVPGAAAEDALAGNPLCLRKAQSLGSRLA